MGATAGNRSAARCPRRCSGGARVFLRGIFANGRITAHSISIGAAPKLPPPPRPLGLAPARAQPPRARGTRVAGTSEHQNHDSAMPPGRHLVLQTEPRVI